jgi:CHASE2 domain-containing sensor protein
MAGFYKTKEALKVRIEKTRREISFLVRLLDFRRWDRRIKIQFLTNLTVGICICAAFHYLEHTSFGEKILNSVFDKMAKKETSQAINRSKDCIGSQIGDPNCDKNAVWASNNIAYIDIDDSAYRLWGEPLIIPREKVARYIRLADKNRARMVVLDLLLDYPSHDKNGDALLRETLEDLTSRNSPLAIIFPVTLRAADRTARPLIYDDIISLNPNFYRALPHVSISRSDRVVRYMKHFESIKLRDGSRGVLFGVPLLASVILGDELGQFKKIEERIISDLQTSAMEMHVYEIYFKDGSNLFIENHELISSRIRFTQIPPGIMQSEGNLFTERILPDEVEGLQSELRGKVVIIGVSSPDKGDIHPTPVGEMPGMYIIGNAISTVASHEQVRPQPFWMRLLIEFVIILFAAFLFLYTTSAAIEIALSVIMVTLLVPLTYHFYMTYGIFINSIFPVMGMSLQRVLGKKWVLSQISKVLSG